MQHITINFNNIVIYYPTLVIATCDCMNHLDISSYFFQAPLHGHKLNDNNTVVK